MIHLVGSFGLTQDTTHPALASVNPRSIARLAVLFHSKGLYCKFLHRSVLLHDVLRGGSEEDVEIEHPAYRPVRDAGVRVRLQGHI